MKPSKFRLESVLGLYAMREDQARAEVGRAVQAREFAGEVLAAARASLDAHTQAYSEHRAGAGFSAASHARHWAALQDGHVACKAQEVHLAAAIQVEAKARGILIEARRKHEMMLKLRGRHLEQERLAGLRHEEHALADFFNANRARRLRVETLEARS